MSGNSELARAVTMIAGAAISRNQLVKFSGTQVIPTVAVTDNACGIALADAAAQGDEITMAILDGKIPMIAGGAVTAGDLLMADTTAGRVVTRTTTNPVVGVAMESAADGELFTVFASQLAGL